MTTHDLLPTVSRRRVLAGLGAVGLTSAGAGFGTTALFADEESFDGNALVAGELDLMVDWQVTYTGPAGLEYVDAFPDNFVNDPDDPDRLLTNQFGFPVTGSDDVQDPVFTRETIAANRGLPIDDPRVEAAFRSQFADVPDDLPRPIIDIDDVKPGDSGEVTFSLHLFDNPGHVWMTGARIANRENSVEEPEAADADENDRTPVPEGSVDDAGELAEAIRVTLWYDENGNNMLDEGETVILGGNDDPTLNPSLADVLDALSTDRGVPLDGDRSSPVEAVIDAGDGIAPAPGTDPDRDCYPNSTTQYVGFEWVVPVDHANEIQTDSVSFDLGFYTEQCRHNPGAGLPPHERLVLAGDSPQGRGAGFAHAWDTSSTLAHAGSGSWGTVDHGPTGTGAATDEDGDGRLEYKQGFYFASRFPEPFYADSLPEFTVSEIDSVSYWLYEPTPLEGVDVYLSIYTQPEGDGDDAASWYDSRLQALPSGANGGSPDFTPGSWNEFATHAGAANVLTWSDTGRSGNFVQPLPTLDRLQDGAIDWSDFGANLSTTHDYSDEQVLALSLQTGSESGVTLEAYVDDVAVELANGARLTLDLEP